MSENNFLDQKYPTKPISKEAFVKITDCFDWRYIIYPFFHSPSYNLAKWLVENRPYYDVVKENSFKELELYIRYLINHG